MTKDWWWSTRLSPQIEKATGHRQSGACMLSAKLTLTMLFQKTYIYIYIYLCSNLDALLWITQLVTCVAKLIDCQLCLLSAFNRIGETPADPDPYLPG